MHGLLSHQVPQLHTNRGREASRLFLNRGPVDALFLCRPGGVYIVISYGIPEFRLNHLQKDEFKWTVELQTVEKPIIPGKALD